MAKKKKSEEKSPIVDSGLRDSPFEAIFATLIMLGVARNPGDIRTSYTDEGGYVSVALPHYRFALSCPGDDPEPLRDKGWHIERVSLADVHSYARVFYALTISQTAKVYAEVDPNVKTTSLPEEKIFGEIVRRKLPIPDRNYTFRRDDGSELTTPDFTWEETKIAFFMDGAYWHSVKNDTEIMRALSKDKKLQKKTIDDRKDKVRKDGEIRSELASRGWIVLSCTDADLETPEGTDKVLGMIERALRNARKVDELTENSAKSSKLEVIDDLLG